MVQFNTANNKVIFLNNLNKTLKLIEKQLMERVITCLKTGEQKLQTKDVFTLDYEVEAEVTYYLEKEDEPCHRFWKKFNYSQVINEKDYGMFADKGKETDFHRPFNAPKLKEAYCYLLHDLIDHSKIGDKIYQMERIWADVIFIEQKGIKINKNGSWRMLENDNCGGFT
jgi:hypothetical protein